jgi:NADPH-dependent glutamate synthase beta subunit-like oxidoreductase
MTATYTFDVFASLDGYGAASANWSGCWGKQGKELLDHRLALYRAEVNSLRVAVVGRGPAGCYAIKELIGVEGIEVDVYERLNTPFGLIRAGVAPVAHHHAVIYAVGTGLGRYLNIPGETASGIYSAADFVSWYNEHPDHARSQSDLSGERAVRTMTAGC